jgi:excisionase family DNA binding protein
MSEEDEYISVDDAAKQLSLHPDSVRRWIRDKELPAYRFRGVYRIKKSDFEKFIKEHRTINEEKDK